MQQNKENRGLGQKKEMGSTFLKEYKGMYRVSMLGMAVISLEITNPRLYKVCMSTYTQRVGLHCNLCSTSGHTHKTITVLA